MSGKPVQYYTFEEVQEHNSRKNLWLVIHGKVYDISSFVEDHPGGEDILMEQIGTDAGVAFDDIGHSTSARKQLESFYIGELVEASDPRWAPKEKANDKGSSAIFFAAAAGLAIVAAAFIYQRTHYTA